MVNEPSTNIELNKENLEEFKNFILRLTDHKDTNPYTSISDTLPLKEVLDFGNTPLNQDQIHVLHSTISKTLIKSPDRIGEFLHLSERHSEIVAYIYQRAANSYGKLFEHIVNTAQKLPFSEQISVADAVQKFENHFISSFVKSDERIEELSGKDKKHLESLILKSKGKDSYYSSEYLDGLYETPILLNCKNLPLEAREKINKKAVETGYWRQLKPEFMDIHILKELTSKNYGLNQPVTNEFNMRTPREKEDYFAYNNVKTALLREIERMPRYDRNNYNKEKTLHQRFKDLTRKISGRTFDKLSDFPKDNSTLLQDLYIYTAQLDIAKGRAAELDPTAINAVIERDKDYYYLKKLPMEVLAHPNVKCNQRQKNIHQIYTHLAKGTPDIDIIDIVIASHIPSKDKKAYIAALEKQMQNNSSVTESLLASEKTYNQALKNKEKTGAEYYTQSIVVTNINNIQKAYSDILKNLNKGTPNAEETMLSAEKLEQLIQNIINGNKTPISLPQQKGLPLLFGRDKEKTRRANLEKAIQKMNDILLHSINNPADLKPYTGKILQDETLQKATAEMKQAQEKDTIALSELQQTYNPEKELNIFRNHNQQIEKAKDILAKQDKTLSNMAKERLGLTSESILENPELANSNKEKHNIRAKNKTRGIDKLAEKAENLKNKDTATKISDVKQYIRQHAR